MAAQKLETQKLEGNYNPSRCATLQRYVQACSVQFSQNETFHPKADNTKTLGISNLQVSEIPAITRLTSPSLLNFI